MSGRSQYFIPHPVDRHWVADVSFDDTPCGDVAQIRKGGDLIPYLPPPPYRPAWNFAPASELIPAANGQDPDSEAQDRQGHQERERRVRRGDALSPIRRLEHASGLGDIEDGEHGERRGDAKAVEPLE